MGCPGNSRGPAAQRPHRRTLATRDFAIEPPRDGAQRPRVIYGVGIDHVEVARFQRIIERFGERALTRLFSKEESDYALRQREPLLHLAARFAAKEAFLKALGTGRLKTAWNDIRVRRSASGRPHLDILGSARALLEERCGSAAQLHVSLSHTNHHATAIALIEVETPTAAPTSSPS